MRIPRKILLMILVVICLTQSKLSSAEESITQYKEYLKNFHNFLVYESQILAETFGSENTETPAESLRVIEAYSGHVTVIYFLLGDIELIEAHPRDISIRNFVKKRTEYVLKKNEYWSEVLAVRGSNNKLANLKHEVDLFKIKGEEFIKYLDNIDEKNMDDFIRVLGEIKNKPNDVSKP